MSAKRHWILAGVLVLEVVLFTAISGARFASVGDVASYLASYSSDLIVQSAPLLFLAFGMTLVLETGGIDLSVGSMVALVAAAMACIDGGMGFWMTALPLGLAVGFTAGLANGVLVARLHMPPLIATLGTMILFRGLCFVLLGDAERAPFVSVPGYGALGELGFVGVFTLVLFLGGGAWLRAARWQRELLVIGGNRVAARYAGIRVERRLVETYALMGGLAFFAAIAFTARNSSVSASALGGLELRVIVAVVLGGTRVDGGFGSLRGSILGVLVIAALEEGLRSAALWGDANLPFKISHLDPVLLGLLLISGVWLHRER